MIGLTIASGLVLNILMARYLMVPILSMNIAVMIIAYFVVSIGCMLIIYKSPNPVISYVAFLGLSAAMGLLLTWVVSMYNIGTVTIAFVITGLITLLMMVISSIYPAFFMSIGRALFIALIGTLVIEVIFRLLIGFDMQIMDYIVALIFSGYIGYDWAKAQRYPKTYDNAVDSAADIYVDIVNLFVRVLSIVGRRD